jgi:uncharacterized protein (UPF0276 family)
MYEHAIKLCGPTNTLLEWDAHIPSFEQVHAEALKARRFLQPQKKAEKTKGARREQITA